MKFLKLSIFFLLMGCSLAGLFIGKVDYFITDAIDDKLDLNSKQERIIEKEIAQLLNEIKPEVKKIYKTDHEKLLTNEELLYKTIPEFAKMYQNIANQFADVLLKNIDLFDKKQKEKLNVELEKSVEKFEKKFKKNKFYKLIYERIEKFTGDLSKKQKKPYRAKRETVKIWQEKKFEINKIYFSRAIELIKQKKSPKREKDLLELKENYFKAYKDLYGEPEYKEIQKLIVATFMSLNEKQKKHLQKEVKYIKGLIKKYLNYDYK